jgi:hypothetical protein
MPLRRAKAGSRRGRVRPSVSLGSPQSPGCRGSLRRARSCPTRWLAATFEDMAMHPGLTLQRVSTPRHPARCCEAIGISMAGSEKRHRAESLLQVSINSEEVQCLFCPQQRRVKAVFRTAGIFIKVVEPSGVRVRGPCWSGKPTSTLCVSGYY